MALAKFQAMIGSSLKEPATQGYLVVVTGSLPAVGNYTCIFVKGKAILFDRCRVPRIGPAAYNTAAQVTQQPKAESASYG